MYASDWRLHVGAMNNVVRTRIEAASPGGERQSMHGLFGKIFGYPHRQLYAPLHEVPVAKGQARESAIYFFRTLPSNSVN